MAVVSQRWPTMNRHPQNPQKPDETAALEALRSLVRALARQAAREAVVAGLWERKDEEET